MEKVAFELFGLTLLEPLSTLMNWVMAAQCAFFYSRLKNEQDLFRKYWSWFFLAYAISLTFGGFSHLLYHYTGMWGKIPGWSVALLGVSAAELAMIVEVAQDQKRRTLLSVIRGKLFATIILLIYDFSFKWVMLHTAGLFFFVGIFSVNRLRAGRKSYRFFLFGIGLLIAMGIVKVAGLDIHPAWFNRDDIAHVFMLLAYWMFFKGVIRH